MPYRQTFTEEVNELTDAQHERLLRQIRARKTVQVGMSVVTLMRYAYGGQNCPQYNKDKAVLSRWECAQLANRAFLDTPLSPDVVNRLLRRIPADLHRSVYERLRIKP